MLTLLGTEELVEVVGGTTFEEQQAESSGGADGGGGGGGDGDDGDEGGVSFGQSRIWNPYTGTWSRFYGGT
ncbi:MAG: hypothetical protein IPG50_03140 [Myxococcales bacterium]|nr:hypothetical protein [Myxococcales bacterium]